MFFRMITPAIGGDGNIPRLEQLSLQAQFAGIAAMLLPLVLFALVDHFCLLPRLLESIDELSGKTADKLTPAARLQNLILRAAMPVNDYLIHGDPPEREDFIKLSGEVQPFLDWRFLWGAHGMIHSYIPGVN